MSADRPTPPAEPEAAARPLPTPVNPPGAAAAPVRAPVARPLLSSPDYFTRGIEVTEVRDTQAAELLDLFAPQSVG